MNRQVRPLLYTTTGLMILLTLCALPTAHAGEGRIRLAVTSDLRFPRTPMDPVVDFGAAIADAGLDGVLDPNSITIEDAATGETVPCAVTEDLAYSDKGRVEWVITNPEHKVYEIRFHTAGERPPLMPRAYTPRIGVGDLLRCNADAPRPIVAPYLSRLVDISGDGKRDLLGTWNYAYRPGWPWDGIICYPRVGDAERFEFGDLVRIRYVDEPGSTGYKHFSTVYMVADFADFNRDGLVDLVYSPRNGDAIHLYLNSGKRDTGGMPVFVAQGSLPRPKDTWCPCRAVDLDRDGAIDFVVGGVYKGDPRASFYLKNTNPDGWPVQLAEPARLDLEQAPCFFDVDQDGQLDAVCLHQVDKHDPSKNCVVWHKNLGGDPPAFAEPLVVASMAPHFPANVAAVTDGPRRGILVLHDAHQVVTFYEHTPTDTDKATFTPFARAQSRSAVMALSDQAWPCACDWDGDGDQDLLVGGGYGWPRIVVNVGTTEMPAYAEPQCILTEGEPIRILRNDILGEPVHSHNMGYPYPGYVDWDADGLPDLMLPNETNRIFWYKNIGTRNKPQFGERRQLLVDDYPDSPELRRLSAERALDATYPLEEEQPFFWRTGAAFADWNNDGLMDVATHGGHTRKLTLFVQHRDEEGRLRLRKQAPMRLSDGRLIDDAIVERAAHWTESFRAIDWDGDGLVDLVYNCAGTEAAKGSIYLLRNVGAKTEPVFDAPRTFCCFGTPIKVTSHGPNAWPADFDGDGKPDLLTCVEWSVYPFYTHAALEMPQRPTFEISAP